MSATGEPGADVARQWVLGRLDRLFDRAFRELIEVAAEEVAVATGDAVTVRSLTPDGTQLLPIATNHPDPGIREAMASVMRGTAERAESGLWRHVIDEQGPRRWTVESSAPPAEASPNQVAFLEQFPVRAILGAPIVFQGGVVGGISLVRYVTATPHTDADESLLVAVADRIAPVIALVNETRVARALDGGSVPR